MLTDVPKGRVLRVDEPFARVAPVLEYAYGKVLPMPHYHAAPRTHPARSRLVHFMCSCPATGQSIRMIGLPKLSVRKHRTFE